MATNLLTSKKKVETGVWNYRGYIISKCTDGWEVTESPETRPDLNKESKKTIKDICVVVDEKVGELEEYEKPQKKEKKAKSTAAIKKKGNRTASEKAIITDRCGMVFAKIASELKFAPPIKTIRGNTTSYKWGKVSRNIAESKDIEAVNVEQLDINIKTIVEKFQLEYRDFRFNVVKVTGQPDGIDENILKITFLE